MDVPVVQTERLTLRGWRDTDLDSLADIYADAEVMRFIGDGLGADRDGTAEHIARMIAHWEEHGLGLWAVEERSTGEMIGRIGLMTREDFENEIEVGWVLARSRWGRGYATEGGAASLEWGFTVLGLPTIISIANAENEASRHVMEKLGMDFGGERASRFQPDWQIAWYRLDREQWVARRG